MTIYCVFLLIFVAAVMWRNDNKLNREISRLKQENESLKEERDSLKM
ncbi:hypothetical protein [Vibrio hepatarius]